MIETIGKYRLIRELGKGATAIVYLAEDPQCRQPVAIKLVRLEKDGEGRYTRRILKLFQGEGNVGKLLDHPNIARIYETVIEENRAYIVMEFVDGRPLDQFVSFERLLPPHAVVGIIFKCCLALDYAFKQGIVHRDIKPANILVNGDKVVKITDFGLAINVSKKRESESTFIMGVGSPAYMSPEQIKGYPLNQKTDIYSLGVVLFQLLTGRLPFRGGNQAQLVYKIINADIPSVSNLNSSVPPALDRIVRRAMEKDQYSRYKNGAEMAKDLSAIRYQILDENYLPIDSSRFYVLRRLSFFLEFEDVEIWEVLRISNWREYDGGTVLMKEGEADATFGVIVSGDVEISLAGKHIARLGTGEPLGELAYLDSRMSCRTTTVTATTPLSYLEVNPSALALASDECQEHFRKQLLATVAQRLARANETIAAHAQAAHPRGDTMGTTLAPEPLGDKESRCA